MDNAKIIRNSITMEQVAEYYGFTINNRGFIRCPFHNEKTSSLKIYKGYGGFSCFGCNTAGSVIDFTMKLFNISFKQAILRLNSDFCLGLSGRPPSKKAINEYKRKQQDKKNYIDSMKLIEEWWTLEFKKHYRVFREQKPKYKFEKLTDEYIAALCELPYLEDKLTELGVILCERHR